MINNIDLEGDGNGYSGTFRWKQQHKFKSLPSISNAEVLCYENGWGPYLRSRCKNDEEGKQLVAEVRTDLSIIDCLSFPLSIAFACSTTKLYDRKTPVDEISIVCIGCSSKAEERILRKSSSWQHLGDYFHLVEHVKLFLVGPEISATSSPVYRSQHQNLRSNMTAHAFKGTTSDFFRAKPDLLNGGCIVVGFNCGFGNFENPLPGRYDLLLSWLPDLKFLSGTQLPVFFFCANDYADLAGEVGLMSQFLGASFIAAPQYNPFAFASNFVPQTENPAGVPNDQRRGSQFTCGNSFWYGIQGSLPCLRRPLTVDPLSPRRADQVSQALKALDGLPPGWTSNSPVVKSPRLFRTDPNSTVAIEQEITQIFNKVLSKQSPTQNTLSTEEQAARSLRGQMLSSVKESQLDALVERGQDNENSRDCTSGATAAQPPRKKKSARKKKKKNANVNVNAAAGATDKGRASDSDDENDNKHKIAPITSTTAPAREISCTHDALRSDFQAESAPTNAGVFVRVAQRQIGTSQLEVCWQLPSDSSSAVNMYTVADVDLSVSYGGEVMSLSLNNPQSSTVSKHDEMLWAPVDPDSVVAKYSTKKKLLTVVANLV